MDGDDDPGPRDELAAHLARILRRKFGGDAVTIAKRQFDVADGESRAAWNAIVLLLSA